MRPLMTTSLILFSCWVMIVKCRAEDLQENVLDFYAIFNGNFENIGQLNKGIGNYDKIQVKLKPVLVPSLQKAQMFYLEEVVNGSVYRMSVGSVTNGPDDNDIYIRKYNFTDTSQHKPGDFNTDKLANLPREAFTSQEGCDCIFKKVFRGEYTGIWPDCRHVVDGHHPVYTPTVNCEAIYTTIALQSYETTTLAPVTIKFTGPRYPLLGAPAGYVSPCKDDQ